VEDSFVFEVLCALGVVSALFGSEVKSHKTVLLFGYDDTEIG
jgi:hypothetical protein